MRTRRIGKLTIDQPRLVQELERIEQFEYTAAYNEFLVEQIAPALYIFIVLVVILLARRWMIARRALRATTFELERSIARHRTGATLTAIALAIEAGLMVYGIQDVVAPTIREDRASLGIVETIPIRSDDGVQAADLQDS